MTRKIFLLITMLVLTLSLTGCDMNSKKKMPEDYANAEMSRYYFDSYVLVGQEYDKDSEITYSTYEVTYSSPNYTYDGEVTLIGYYYGSDDAGHWECELSYNDDFEFDIDGMWAGVMSDWQKVGLKDCAYQIEIIAVDTENDSISFQPKQFVGKSSTVGEVTTTELYDEELRLPNAMHFPGEEEEKRYEAPVFGFQYSNQSGEYMINIHDEYLRIDGEGNHPSFVFVGMLYKGCCVEIYELNSHTIKYNRVPYEGVQLKDEAISENELKDSSNNTDLYGSVLDGYRDYMISGYLKADGYYVSEDSDIAMAGSNGNINEIRYDYVDIDRNGTDELIIGVADDTGFTNIFEIWTYDGSKPYKFSEGEYWGWSAFVMIFENGRIAAEMNSGDGTQGVTIYEINKNGYEKKKVGSESSEVGSKEWHYNWMEKYASECEAIELTWIKLEK